MHCERGRAIQDSLTGLYNNDISPRRLKNKPKGSVDGEREHLEHASPRSSGSVTPPVHSQPHICRGRTRGACQVRTAVKATGTCNDVTTPHLLRCCSVLVRLAVCAWIMGAFPCRNAFMYLYQCVFKR